MFRSLLSGVFLCAWLAATAAAAQDCSLDAAMRAAIRGDDREVIAVADRVIACPDISDAVRSQAHALRGRSLNHSGQHALAREALKEAIRLAPASNPLFTANAYHELGWILFEIEGPEPARKAFATAVELTTGAGDEPLTSKFRLALVFAMRPGPERLTLIEDGLAGARARGDRTLEAGYLQHLGEQHMFDGHYIDAIVMLRQAAVLFEAQNRTADLIRSHQQLSRLYRKHGRPDLARDTLAHAASLLEGKQQPRDRATREGLLAKRESAIGHSARAIEHQLEAIRISKQTDSRRTNSLLELELAWFYTHAGRPQDAADIAARLVESGDTFIARISWDALSVAYLALGRYREAANAADRALSGTYEPSGTPTMLETRARARRALGEREAALADVQEALARIERMRAKLVPTDSMKQGFAELTQDLFDLAITLHAELGHATEALSVSEQARSRAFLDLLASRRERDALAALDDAAPAAPALGDIPSVEHAQPFSAADYAALASRLQSTILVYWVGDERSFVWIVPPTGTAAMKTIPAGRGRLERLIAGTLPGAAAGTRGAEAQAPPLPTAVLDVATRPANWRTLHHLLIEPAAAALPSGAGARLTIVPHGPLVQLSFAALRSAADEYLLERYAIHYLPAAAAIARSGERSTPGAALIVGAPDRFPSVRGLSLAPLPGAAAEARAIARHYRTASAHTVVGASAGERAVRERLDQAGFLHFATHAVTPPDAPLEAFLALRPGSSAPEDDGRLTLAEIYQLRLPARLVVLSACRSASGDGSTDGVAGFARAFLSAGVRTVVGGLWEVPDLTSAMLMRDFYAHVDAGYASALRRAQLRLLRALRAGEIIVGSGDRKALVAEDPALWAGFIVLGEP